MDPHNLHIDKMHTLAMSEIKKNYDYSIFLYKSVCWKHPSPSNFQQPLNWETEREREETRCRNYVCKLYQETLFDKCIYLCFQVLLSIFLHRKLHTENVWKLKLDFINFLCLYYRTRNHIMKVLGKCRMLFDLPFFKSRNIRFYTQSHQDMHKMCSDKITHKSLWWNATEFHDMIWRFRGKGVWGEVVL